MQTADCSTELDDKLVCVGDRLPKVTSGLACIYLAHFSMRVVISPILISDCRYCC